ncbi:3-oxoacyl-ACP reductase family protein [Parasphingorhabdus sp.]|uniref:SDR family NAD(P)-dependent oxidoreductase n=1 Tax=Parasphingorhabdus sp. TaxID=2709688 RepID=UPI002B26B850|nr:3-oxoacyl-ACP reductase family protein [Parasphingorhabdus sp.]|tara:strand:- start:463 stop:1230 length:768 start_codon:yes stop_codon:yes gene_type:complete
MTNPASLEGKTIIVTGAAQGIGKALCEQALAMGANVAAVDINEAALSESFGGKDRVLMVPGDVTDPAFPELLVEQTVARFGGLHGLLNNAGIVRAAMIADMSRDQWQSVIDVNLTGAFAIMQAVGRHLIAQAKNGDTNPGSIVNISSDAGRKGTVGQINYGAAKSGMLGLTMSAAREWGRFNINVNSACYGLVETPMTETIRQEKFRDRYLDQIPLRRFSRPEDVAPATCFLLSDAAAYITGQHLAIDGGFHITA